jgi:hypothetical protein
LENGWQVQLHVLQELIRSRWEADRAAG